MAWHVIGYRDVNIISRQHWFDRAGFYCNGLFAENCTGTRVGFFTAKAVQSAKVPYITYAHFTGPRIITPTSAL